MVKFWRLPGPMNPLILQELSHCHCLSGCHLIEKGRTAFQVRSAHKCGGHNTWSQIYSIRCMSIPTSMKPLHGHTVNISRIQETSCSRQCAAKAPNSKPSSRTTGSYFFLYFFLSFFLSFNKESYPQTPRPQQK